MALRIKYTTACECGEAMQAVELDLTQDPGEQVVIDLDMIGDLTLECPACYAQVFLPDLSDYMQEIE